jgi:hypothetical protein
MQYTGELGQYFRHQVRRWMMASVQPSRDASSNSSARRHLRWLFAPRHIPVRRRDGKLNATAVRWFGHCRKPARLGVVIEVAFRRDASVILASLPYFAVAAAFAYFLYPAIH